jgi:uncharacterized membrane protein YidH (DUF202 family)
LTHSLSVSQAASRPFPRLARLGLVGLAFGLLLDFVEHDFVSHVREATIAGFPVSEHLAHFVVFVGMILILVGIVRDGIRGSSRLTHERRSPDALR